MTLIAFLYGAGIGWLVYLIYTAPCGYQDEAGFHLLPPNIADGEGTPFEHIFELRHDARDQGSDLFHTKGNT